MLNSKEKNLETKKLMIKTKNYKQNVNPTGWLFNEKQVDKDTHKQTFTLVDGISGPVKMEKV